MISTAVIDGSGGWVLDALLLIILVAQAVAGWRQGLLVGIASLGGFALGLIVGATIIVRFVLPNSSGGNRLLLVLVGAVVAGVVVQAVAVAVAYRLRRGIGSRSVRVLDTAIGAVVGLVAAAAVVWVLTWGLRSAPLPVFNRVVDESRVVGVLDLLAPPAVQRSADRFFAQVSGEWFPRVFQAGGEQIRDVPAPDSSVAGAPGVVEAAASVVKIRGEAEACGRGQEGSGFVVEDGRVVTNAHVVAGMPAPQVQVGGVGDFLPASVVAFDSQRDLAVLDVPDLVAPALPVTVDAAAGDAVAVLGFPNDGDYDVQPGRVRDVLTAVGDDIYGNSGTARQVYSVFATVRPGNSGGPLVSVEGEVVGVVFARSVTDSSTGYALTTAELNPMLELAAGASAPVDVGACSVG